MQKSVDVFISALETIKTSGRPFPTEIVETMKAALKTQLDARRADHQIKNQQNLQQLLDKHGLGMGVKFSDFIKEPNVDGYAKVDMDRTYKDIKDKAGPQLAESILLEYIDLRNTAMNFEGHSEAIMGAENMWKHVSEVCEANVGKGKREIFPATNIAIRS